MIDARYISAMVSSVQDLAGTMLGVSAMPGEPVVRTDAVQRYDVSAIIGLSGACVGTLAMGFPTDTALGLVERFVGSPVTVDHPDFADAIGELANMVAGGAKTKFQIPGVSISCPSVVVGSGHQVFQRRDMPVIEIPIRCDCGGFVMLVSLRAEAAASPASSAARVAG